MSIKNTQSLTRLDVSSNFISDEGAYNMIETLKVTGLAELGFASNLLKERVARELNHELDGDHHHSFYHHHPKVLH